MAPSDSEEEVVDDLDFDAKSSEADEDEVDVDDATEGGDEESYSDDSEDGSDENDDESEAVAESAQGPLAQDRTAPTTESTTGQPNSESVRVISPVPQRRSLSPARARREQLVPAVTSPRTYTVEAICAIPHPVATHSLTASACMTHVITGSDDGYIRDYDIFSAVNGKTFLTAPQRHHCGVVEGTMKSGHHRTWWENLADPTRPITPGTEPELSPVYSLLMQSDALWGLSGTALGKVNLFTVRHEPGRICHVLHGHGGPVSALAMQHDEAGFFSAGWDGETLQWDLNTGQMVRNFSSHGAQLVAVAVKPLGPPYVVRRPTPNRSSVGGGDDAIPANTGAPNSLTSMDHSQPSTATSGDTIPTRESDSKSDASFDPLFDDEPDAEGEQDTEINAQSNSQPLGLRNEAHSGTPIMSDDTHISQTQRIPGRAPTAPVAPHRHGPPVLDDVTYPSFSPDILMTASIDGQVLLWDRRVNFPSGGVGRLWMSDKTPPWCLSACWSVDGAQIYAGRRNGTVDVWDVRQLGRFHTGIPRLLKSLRNPVSANSNIVSCVAAFPDGHHIVCASNDNIRLWNVSDAGETDASGKAKTGMQFKIISGHHGGCISQMLIDPAGRFLISSSGNRGWHGDSTRTVLVHDIKPVL